MKVVILDTRNTDAIIESFIAHGYTEFIVFGRVNLTYYALNKIDVTRINGFACEGGSQRLQKIRGSLKNRFFVAYAPVDVDLASVEKRHSQGQGTVTVIEQDKRMVAAILEPEVFDYMDSFVSLEKDVLPSVGNDGDLQVYN